MNRDFVARLKFLTGWLIDTGWLAGWLTDCLSVSPTASPSASPTDDGPDYYWAAPSRFHLSLCILLYLETRDLALLYVLFCAVLVLVLPEIAFVSKARPLALFDQFKAHLEKQFTPMVGDSSTGTSPGEREKGDVTRIPVWSSPAITVWTVWTQVSEELSISPLPVSPSSLI